MEHKRKFIIQVFYENENNLIGYISKVHKLKTGYFYMTTLYYKKSKVWKSQKTCQNAINRIEKTIDPTKSTLLSRKLKVLEITDNQTLRNIKLKKLKK